MLSKVEIPVREVANSAGSGVGPYCGERGRGLETIAHSVPIRPMKKLNELGGVIVGHHKLNQV